MSNDLIGLIVSGSIQPKFYLTLICDNQNIQLEIYVHTRFNVSKLVYIELKRVDLIDINQRSIKQSKQNAKALISINIYIRYNIM